MIKRIVLTEDGNKMLIYDMGDTLQFVCEGKKFNIKKEKVMFFLINSPTTSNTSEAINIAF